MTDQQLRNGLVAGANGGVTLIILLVAPLGLAAVLLNTALVVMTSYWMGQLTDRIWMRSKEMEVELLADGKSTGTTLKKR